MTAYDVVILPSFAQVDTWRKRHVGLQAGGIFSQTATTFDGWIADLWDLHGDGRAIVDAPRRELAMRVAFESAPALDETAFGGGRADAAQAGDTTFHLARLASRCALEASGIPAFEAALQAVRRGRVPAGLSNPEASFLSCIARYRQQVGSLGLVEVGEAAALLAERSAEVFPQRVNVLVAEAGPMEWRAAHFFETCERADVTFEEALGSAGVGRLPAGVRPRFGFPSGRYAQPALVADLVRERIAKGPSDVVVTCIDPIRMHSLVAEALAGEGAFGRVEARAAFRATDFGRAVISLFRALDGGSEALESIVDAVASPFSGFSPFDARELDVRLRGDRIVSPDETIAALRAYSDTFSQLEELVCDPGADILIGVFEQMALEAPGRSPAWRAEQLSAMRAMRSCTAAARDCGASMASCVSVLERSMVAVAYEDPSFASSRMRVTFTSQDLAAAAGERSCDMVIACDLVAQDYPIADRDDAAATLFSKLGIARADSELARARRTFHALGRLAKDEFVCVRPLNDWDGNPTYPCAVLQELIDSYCDGQEVRGAGRSNASGLPEALGAEPVWRGEETALANARAVAVAEALPAAQVVSEVRMGAVSPHMRCAVLLPRRTADGSAPGKPGLSPSQIEAYLECPYRWFVERRLRATALDEGFGPLEKGVFAHSALEEFYRRFQEAGYSKVDDANLPAARLLMEDVVGGLAAAQREVEAGHSRLVAATRLEGREVEALCSQLVDYLDYEARLLPGFHPWRLEYEVDAADAVEYAGCALVGTVDRIDVDEAGHAVIIDYKGSLGPRYQIYGATDALPGKVQTRIYAQVVRRLLGLDVVGALYVSYGPHRCLSGAFDARVLEAPHLPDMRVERCGCSPHGDDPVEDGEAGYAALAFADMLDRTEEAVARAVDSLVSGVVDPGPAVPDVCLSCPVAHCPKRGA